MTRGTVPEAGMGRRSETRVTPTESRSTMDGARAQPSTHRRACPRVAALSRCQVLGGTAPAPHGSDFPPPASGPFCVPGTRRPAG